MEKVVRKSMNKLWWTEKRQKIFNKNNKVFV